MPYNFNINFDNVLADNVPPVLNQPKRFNFLRALVKPFKMIWADFIAQKNAIEYQCKFNGETIYLETTLNDRFDNVLRRIYIEDAFFDPIFIYKRSEAKPPQYLYKRWQSTISFPSGTYCMYQNAIYKANATALNKIPGIDPEWDLQVGVTPVYVRKRSNYSGQISFTVFVPTGLTYSDSEMRSLIRYYKLAGPGYQIKTF